jgi:hypothetical protein
MSDKEDKPNEKFSMRYWDYFCALESDFKKISRFIDFSDDNLKTHSIELTRLILSSCSEIDVILKEICLELNENAKPTNIREYQKIIKKDLQGLIGEKVNIGFNFFGIQPFETWKNDKTPNWWKMYNEVKHQRNKFYKEANLENALNSISALFICVNYYYKIVLSDTMKKKGEEFTFKEVTMILKSDSNFMKFQADYYIAHLRIS